MQRELMKSFGNESQFSPMPSTAVQANTFFWLLRHGCMFHVNGKKCISAHVGSHSVDCGSTQTGCAQFMCAKKKKKI